MAPRYGTARPHRHHQARPGAAPAPPPAGPEPRNQALWRVPGLLRQGRGTLRFHRHRLRVFPALPSWVWGPSLWTPCFAGMCQMLLQLRMNLNGAQFLDTEDHLMGLKEKLFPHSILHPPAPLHQPRSVFKDVTTSSHRLQKWGESSSEALGCHFTETTGIKSVQVNLSPSGKHRRKTPSTVPWRH